MFQLDVNNTLLDMGRAVADPHAHPAQGLEAVAAQRCWVISAGMLQEFGEVDYLAALQALGREMASAPAAAGATP